MKLRLSGDLINLNDVPQHLPVPTTAQSVKRWARVGCHGVKLRTIKVGNARFTTLDAIEEFCLAISQLRDATSTDGTTRGVDGRQDSDSHSVPFSEANR